MTENDVISGLETLKYQCKYNGECGTCDICYRTIPLAVQALEEIQQYRTIGLTPTMVQDLIKSCKKHERNALENAHIVDDYREIGTVDEFKEFKALTVTQNDIDTFKAYIDDCMDEVSFGNTDWNHSFSLALKCMESHLIKKGE